ncbi:MAG: drug/metabolite exporter YedA [Gemmatimonadetes bacterium]|nr:drug/metabolite exporter YedA [Gemmatimonadota bacterium]
MSRTASPLAVALAFLAIYVIWGSTYLAIRFGVESMPPFLMAAARFAIPGALLYAWCRWRGVPKPTARQWNHTFRVGALLLLGGNGIVTWAEQWVPSGITALMIASVSLWMVLFAWIAEPANRPGPRALFGLALGFLGVAVLVQPRGDLGHDPHLLLGGLSLVVASGFWAAGSVWSRRADLPENAVMATGMEMLGGAAALAVVGTLAGDWSRLDPSAITMRSALSLLYLIVFGSVIAFNAYVWLLKVSTPSKVATYAYVNPMVAVILGWALAGETLSRTSLIAAGVIVLSVVLITTDRARSRPAVREPIAVDVDSLAEEEDEDGEVGRALARE